MSTVRRPALLVAVAALAIVVAVPVLGADPTSSPAPAASGAPEPTRPPRADKPDKPSKADRAPEVAAEVRGTVRAATDAKGRPTYAVTVAGATWELEAGPAWFWGDDHPLQAFVGRTVTLTGTTREGSLALDVEAVDGTPIRGPGKPPWAGGPKVVGERHPGWKAWKADKAAAKAAAKAAERAARDAAKPDAADEPAPSPGS